MTIKSSLLEAYPEAEGDTIAKVLASALDAEGDTIAKVISDSASEDSSEGKPETT